MVLNGSSDIECPLWVRSGHMQRTNPCPLYPNSDRESGHLPPGHVCFTPESGHVRCNVSCRLWANSGHRLQLLNQFVGTGKKRIRDRKA